MKLSAARMSLQETVSLLPKVPISMTGKKATKADIRQFFFGVKLKTRYKKTPIIIIDVF